MPRRTEIVFYLPADQEPKREYVSFLRTSARFVYDYQTWLTWGHTIPNGDPPKPIFAGSPFVSVLFLFPLFKPDNQLAEQLVLDGDPVSFLWIVPLTAAEQRYKIEHGTEALQEAFNRARLPFVFNEKRASCCVTGRAAQPESDAFSRYTMIEFVSKFELGIKIRRSTVSKCV